MRKIFIPLMMVSFFVGLLLYKPTNSKVQDMHISVHGVYAEVYPIEDYTRYKLCGTAMKTADAEVILVSSDLADCGDSITIQFIDGSIMSSQVAGILLDSPKKTVQVYNIETPEVTQVVVRNYNK